MLIDDDPADLLLVGDGFAAFGTHGVVTGYQSGASAIEAMQQPSAVLPDVILLDLNMPMMNGFDVLRLLKADEKLSFIPVVMLTASAQAQDVTQAYSLFASSYIVKADSFAGLIEQVETFIGFWTRMRRVGDQS